MKVAIILNGVSRKKKKFYKEVQPVLARHLDLKVYETQRSGEAEILARQAMLDRFEIILAAGGDGTLNQVINGVMNDPVGNAPIVGIIPMGTGNDFAKMCGIRMDTDQIIQLVNAARPQPTDVGKIVCCDPEGNSVIRYFINACSIGMGPKVVDRLVNTSRAWGPQITYLSSIISVFFTHKPQEVMCKADSWIWQGKARVIAIANGISFGNAMYIAPDAKPDDGALNTFIAGDLSLLKFLLCVQRIKGRKKINDEKIRYNTIQHISLHSPQPCLLEAEGEMAGLLPATISILTNGIKFLR